MSPLHAPPVPARSVARLERLGGYLQYPPALNRFLIDEHGQDLIEYGLLLGILASGLALLIPILTARMGTTFTTFGTNSNNLWVPSDPP